MDEREKNDIHRRIEAWRIAGTVLDEERRARLRAMTDDECRSIIAKIFSPPLPPYRERPSGLVATPFSQAEMIPAAGVIGAAREVQDRLARAGFRLTW